MGDLLQYVLNGLAKGSIYSMIALGLVVIYRGTGHLNFAQGEMALFATFFTWWLNDQGIPLFFAVLISAVVAFAVGGLIEFILMRPAARRSPFAPVVVSIGLFQALNSFSGMLYKGAGNGLAFGSLFPNNPDDFLKLPGGAVFRYERLGVLLTVLAIAGVLFLLFSKTKIGLGMRMVANNPESARLSGVPISSVLMVSWGIATSIGAIGGALVAGINANVNLGMMFSVFLLGSAAATLGGLDSPLGALVGGLILGVVESLVANYPNDWWGATYIGEDTAIAVAFVIILGVLLVRPSGLFGTPRVERV
jgi:branched-chain amino acid transport system permease protein